MNILKNYLFKPNFDLDSLKIGQVVALIQDDFDDAELCLQKDLYNVSKQRKQRLINEICFFKCAGRLGVSLKKISSFKDLRTRLLKSIESRMFISKYKFQERILQFHVFKAFNKDKITYLIVSQRHVFVKNSPDDDYCSLEFSTNTKINFRPSELVCILSKYIR